METKIDDILTRKEREIIKLVAKGFDNKAIMQKLSISVGTIQRHFFNIYSKLLISDGGRDGHSTKRVRLAIKYLKQHKEILDELDY